LVCSLCEAMAGTLSMGSTAAYSRCNNGPRALPCGAPADWGEFCICHALLKAWDMSKNAAEQYCLFSRVSFILTIQCVFYCGVPLPEAELMIGY
jgi:hypothetical protein